MGLEIGTEMSMTVKPEDSAMSMFAHYRKLGTDAVNGLISGPVRTADIAMKYAACVDMVEGARRWIESIKRTMQVSPHKKHGLPVELAMGPTETGAGYKIEMADLDQEITWEKSSDTVTMLASQAWEVSIEAFIYYVDTLGDLLGAIAIQRAAQ